MGEPLNSSWHLFANAHDAATAVAERLSVLVAAATEERRTFSLALSGGTTPQSLFSLLVREYDVRIPWSEVEFGFVDERAVGPDDPRSNFGQANRELFRPLKVPSDHIHRIEGEARSVDVARDRYEEEIRTLLGSTSVGPLPSRSFDVVLLGVGTDGHTGSLFPGAASLAETSRWVAVETHPSMEPKVPRITLTLPAIAAAGHALFLVLGKAKRPVLQRILRDPNLGSPQGELPAARVRTLEGTEWFLDAEALPERRNGPRREKG